MLRNCNQQKTRGIKHKNSIRRQIFYFQEKFIVCIFWKKFAVDTNLKGSFPDTKRLKKRRHQRELAHKLEMQKLELDRRREEREHELKLVQMMMKSRGYNVPFAMPQHYEGLTSTNSSYSSDGDNSHFQL